MHSLDRFLFTQQKQAFSKWKRWVSSLPPIKKVVAATESEKHVSFIDKNTYARVAPSKPQNTQSEVLDWLKQFSVKKPSGSHSYS